MSNPITDSHTVSLLKQPDSPTAPLSTQTSSSPLVIPPVVPSKTLTVDEMLAAAAKNKVKQAVVPSWEPPSVTTVDKPTLESLLEKYVTVKTLDNTSSHFRFEGICAKCGFHSMQFTEDAARIIIRGHVQQHWRDVVNQ